MNPETDRRYSANRVPYYLKCAERAKYASAFPDCRCASCHVSFRKDCPYHYQRVMRLAVYHGPDFRPMCEYGLGARCGVLDGDCESCMGQQPSRFIAWLNSSVFGQPVGVGGEIDAFG